MKACAYRVAQEGLTNVWRHSQGSAAELSLGLTDGVLQVSVKDRGPGFAVNPKGGAGDDGHGLGLAGLVDRVESLGGELEMRNRPGGGAELHMRLDLREVG
mgnify:CR=1 FL=1